ncbi:MAG: hypothetical protein Q8O92_04280 [Candidatus Latescibacter sp.]|nr:hypothetical protein [Candidatus Latescibacter sp.]
MKWVIMVMTGAFLLWGAVSDFVFAEGAYPSEVNILLKNIAQCDSLIVSGKGSITYEFFSQLQKRSSTVENPKMPAPPDYQKVDIVYSFQGSKMRCDEKLLMQMPDGKSHPAEFHRAWNGEKTDNLTKEAIGPNGSFVSAGSVGKKNDVPYGKCDPRFNCININGEPIAVYINKNLSKLQLIGDETIENIPCKVLQGTRVMQNNMEVTNKIWIAPSRMYRIMRWERSSNLGKIQTVNNTLRKIKDDIWFTEKQQIDTYRNDDTTKEMKYWGKTVLSVSKDFTINITLPDKEFEIKFPTGLSIRDERTNSSFIAK